MRKQQAPKKTQSTIQLKLKAFDDDGNLVIDKSKLDNIYDIKFENSYKISPEVIILQHVDVDIMAYYTVVINTNITLANVVRVIVEKDLEPAEIGDRIKIRVMNDITKRILTGTKFSFSTNIAPVLYKARMSKLHGKPRPWNDEDLDLSISSSDIIDKVYSEDSDSPTIPQVPEDPKDRVIFDGVPFPIEPAPLKEEVPVETKVTMSVEYELGNLNYQDNEEGESNVNP